MAGSCMTIAEKLRDVRKDRKLSQASFADALGFAVSKISDIENNLKTYTDEQILVLKKLLGIEGAPLTDGELTTFKKRLYIWRDYIKNNRIDEGRKLHQELMVITKLSFERDLCLLYRIFEAKQLTEEDNFSAARDILESIEGLLNDTCNENKYHFYYTMGTLCIHERNAKDALAAYEMASSLEVDGLEKEVTLYYNMAICYSFLGRYVRTINAILQIYNEFDHSRINAHTLRFDNELAINYVRINQIDQAIGLLENALDKAKNLDNRAFVGITFHNLGCAYRKLDKHEEAIEYFDKAAEYFEEGTSHYLENLYFKALCLIALKKKSQYKSVLLRSESLSEKSEHYALLFRSLAHLLSIRDEHSVDFIEGRTIPYLLEGYYYYLALDFCDALISVHTKNEAKVKALEIKALRGEIVSKITFGGGNT